MDANHQRGVNEEDTEVLQFNLTNPEELSKQLETANLNEEETDLILNDAMKLNAQLKEILRNQQLGETTSQGSRTKGSRRPKSTSKREYSTNHPLAEQFIPRSPKKTLPPIGMSDRHGDRATKPKSGKTRGSSDGAGPAGPKQKGSAKRQVVDNRPAWDDRFSFT